MQYSAVTGIPSTVKRHDVMLSPAISWWACCSPRATAAHAGRSQDVSWSHTGQQGHFSMPIYLWAVQAHAQPADGERVPVNLQTKVRCGHAISDEIQPTFHAKTVGGEEVAWVVTAASSQGDLKCSRAHPSGTLLRESAPMHVHAHTCESCLVPHALQDTA